MWFQAVAVLSLASMVSLQCISDNDNRNIPSSPPDLEFTDQFGLNLFHQLHPAGSKENFFYSPYSVWNALLLAYFGSKGRTQTELEAALGGLGRKSATLAWYRGLARLYEERRVSSTDYVFDMANRIYMQTGLRYNECIGHELPNELQQLDFGEPNQAAAIINGFVNETTRGKIPTLVMPGAVSGSLMVFVNAAYFKGLWLNKFNPQDTRQKDFFVAPDKAVPVDMMFNIGNFKSGFSSELNADILEMPYNGDVASMFVLLPRSTGGEQDLDDMLQNLNPVTLRKAMADITLLRNLVVEFPKFKLETTIAEDNKLVRALNQMGIQDLFSPSNANLTTYSPVGGLYVDDGIHKAVLEVNEEGSEAAAATAFIVPISSPVIQREFICNRPFLFFIHDNEINNIMFLGVFRKPEA